MDGQASSLILVFFLFIFSFTVEAFSAIAATLLTRTFSHSSLDFSAAKLPTPSSPYFRTYPFVFPSSLCGLATSKLLPLFSCLPFHLLLLPSYLPRFVNSFLIVFPYCSLHRVLSSSFRRGEEFKSHHSLFLLTSRLLDQFLTSPFFAFSLPCLILCLTRSQMICTRVFISKERKGEETAGIHKLLADQNLIFPGGRPLNPG